MRVPDFARIGIDIGGTFTDFAVELGGQCYRQRC
jgi:hypothetical protein